MNELYRHAILLLLLNPCDSILDEELPLDALPVLRAIAIELDVAEQTTPWVRNMTQEIRWTRAALARTRYAPPSHHASLLPDNEACRRGQRTAEQWIATVENWGNQSWHAREQADGWLDECRWRLKVWTLADDATCLEHGPFPDRRRVALESLRKELGPAAYYRGRLPTPVPLEMLRVRD